MLSAAGCVVQDERPMAPVVAQKATAEIPQAELLDVGVRMFDPNIPPDPAEQEKRGIYPDVRKAESRYMPVLLRDTLESTGQWGQVRVLPAESSGSDVNIAARIIESDGSVLQLAVTVTDATGRTWLRKDYEGLADTRAYKDVPVKPRDPFDNVYATIANDLLAARNELTREQRVQVHQVANLRFASELAPYAFTPYLAHDPKRGTYAIARLPAEDDPVVQRLERVHERDYALIDTLNEHYTNFGETIDDAYGNWRKYSRCSRHRRRHGGTEHQQQCGQCCRDGGRHRRHLRVQERPRHARGDQDARRVAEAAQQLVPERGAAERSRHRGPHARAEGLGGTAVRGMAASAARAVRERDGPAGGACRRCAGGQEALSSKR
jgi:hypothetical protein